jgi:hypothetical protein
MALGVVSSNPPPLVDILPDSHESGIFLPGFCDSRIWLGGRMPAQSVRFSNTR